MQSSVQKDPPQEPAPAEWSPEARAGIELLKGMFREFYRALERPAVAPAEKSNDA